MGNSIHQFRDLFAQLGLPADDDSIQQFLQTHRLRERSTALADAPFWSPAQAAFLREQILQDADWAVLVDQLALALISEPS